MLTNGDFAVLPSVKHNLHCIVSSPPSRLSFLTRITNYLPLSDVCVKPSMKVTITQTSRQLNARNQDFTPVSPPPNPTNTIYNNHRIR